MESTYGDRNHRSLQATALEAREIIRKAIETKAKILVPVFAIGRTQLLLYLLAGAFRPKTLPRFPIYVDRPPGSTGGTRRSSTPRPGPCLIRESSGAASRPCTPAPMITTSYLGFSLCLCHIFSFLNNARNSLRHL